MEELKSVEDVPFRRKFFENPGNDTARYLGHFQQLKRSRLQEKFRVVAFLMRKMCSKTLMFSNFTK